MAHITQRTWITYAYLENYDQFVYQGPWKVDQVFTHTGWTTR